MLTNVLQRTCTKMITVVLFCPKWENMEMSSTSMTKMCVTDYHVPSNTFFLKWDFDNFILGAGSCTFPLSPWIWVGWWLSLERHNVTSESKPWNNTESQPGYLEVLTLKTKLWARRQPKWAAAGTHLERTAGCWGPAWADTPATLVLGPKDRWSPNGFLRRASARS